MKRIPVSTLVEKLSEITSECNQQVLKQFGSLTKEQLNWQPNERSWSIAQCLAHLNAYYRYYTPVFRGKISNTRFKDPTEFFSSSPLGIAVYRSVKLGKVNNVKRKLKSTKDYNPLVNTSLPTENVIKEYGEHTKEFIDVINEGSSVNMRKTKCPLSLRPVVKLNLGDALIFMAYHNERHLEQMKKITRFSDFPA